MAASRPAPGPFTKISIDLHAVLHRAPGRGLGVTCAAKGVLLREPLKPCAPAEPQAMTLPSGSVRVTMVLLNVAGCARARPRSFLRSRRRVRDGLLLLGHDLLLARLLAAHADGLLRAPAGARVGAGALAAHRQAAAVAQAAVGADLGETLDVERDLAAQVAFDAALQLLGDDIAQLADLASLRSLVRVSGAHAASDSIRFAVVGPIP